MAEKTDMSNIQDSIQKKVSLSVFMPFYNEEANVRRAVESAVTFLKKLQNLSAFEVIIVDDGSTDATREIAATLVSEYDNVRLVSHEENIGYGGAIATGIRSCQYEYIFFTDGDLQFDIADIHNLLSHIASSEAVIGYRSKRQDSFMRLANAYVWNFMNRVCYGLHARDINCAFKLFRREVIAELPLISKGAMISSEILVRLKKAGIAFVEVPVTHLPRLKGRSTGANFNVIFKAGIEFMFLYIDIQKAKKLAKRG